MMRHSPSTVMEMRLDWRVEVGCAAAENGREMSAGSIKMMTRGRREKMAEAVFISDFGLVRWFPKSSGVL